MPVLSVFGCVNDPNTFFAEDLAKVNSHSHSIDANIFFDCLLSYNVEIHPRLWKRRL